MQFVLLTHTPLIQEQIEKRATELNISVEDGGRALLTEKQPSNSLLQRISWER